MSILRRVCTVAAATALALAGSAVVVATPAVAVAGRVVVSATTPTDTASKIATVSCPAGTLLLGGGGDVVDGVGRVRLYRVGPSVWGGQVMEAGAHQDPQSGVAPVPFAVTVWAICGTGVTGHEIVNLRPAIPGYQLSGSASASCPAGKKVIGMGGGAHKSLLALLTGIRVDSALSTVTVDWHRRPDNQEISGTAYVWAICVNPVPGQQRVSAQSATGTADKLVFAYCPFGTEPHAVGGGVEYGGDAAMLDAVAPVAPNRVFVDARDTFFGAAVPWRAYAQAICA
ncbi:hypothetical protein ACFQY4_15855 [Catellatospora bangladeshensis]|uniref:Uncharacterized protein n=1 Tax=Catellatospora bangladeshensis TaxID=310355 RepID=A0A8J3NNS7_9ACTN|nr:hypothetical protein [Catellatospora bangladeshensis]GIF86428.1 hypothetical protein Cba03nite_77770 [Catellatospora bangladeshensis]